MMSRSGRRARAGVASAVIALTLFGTRYSEDEAFPFGPMSMFAFRTVPDGEVAVASVRGIAEGATDEIVLSTGSFGLRRAEVEGSLGRMQQDPALLGDLVLARERIHGNLPKLTYVRIVQSTYLLQDGQKVGLRESTVAEWRR
ncbi:MAG: hypothetical protein ABIM89_13720 [Mycobacteriales bacterium]